MDAVSFVHHQKGKASDAGTMEGGYCSCIPAMQGPWRVVVVAAVGVEECGYYCINAAANYKDGSREISFVFPLW